MKQPSLESVKTVNKSDKLDYKKKWMSYIEKCTNPRHALQTFCYNYYYFSLHQILAFSKLIAHISPFDRKSLAILGQTVYDELGCGVSKDVHSVLFEHFMVAVGASMENRPNADTVLPNVANYIRELDSAFSGDSLPKALASYVYLEKSATESYGPLYETLKKALPKLTPDELIFFSHHAILEPEHEKAARQLVVDQHFAPHQMEEFDKQYHHLDECWTLFWCDIYKETLANE